MQNSSICNLYPARTILNVTVLFAYNLLKACVILREKNLENKLVMLQAHSPTHVVRDVVLS